MHDDRGREAPGLPQAGHIGTAPDPEAAERGRGARARAARDRGHELPVPRRRGVARRPVGPGRRGWRRHLRLPGRPGLGPRRPVRPRPRAQRYVLRPRGRLPPRRGRLRRRTVRDQPARGPQHGPAAAAAPGDVVAAVRTRGPRSARSCRQPGGRVRRHQRSGLRPQVRHRPTGGRGLLPDRERGERGIGPGGLRVRAGGSGGDGGHGVLVVAGGDAPRRAGAAFRRVLHGAGRRRLRDVDAPDVRAVQPAAGAVRRRAVQGVRRLGGRHGLGRGRRPAAAGTVVGRGGERAPGARGAARFGGESGRCVERSDGAERSVAAAGDPAGPVQRRPRCW
ncbi:hypothetical protein Sgri01_05738 [Streptomyces griseus]